MMNPLSQYLMIGKLVALLGAIALICYQGSQIHKWHQHSLQLSELRAADRRAYEAAQVQAQAKNDATLTRVKSEQEAITHEVTSDLNSRLELIRRELRAQSGANQGSAGGTKSSPDGETPCRAYDPAWLCVAPEARLRGAEDEERHEQLIDWVKRQSEVNPNSGPDGNSES